MFMTLGEWLDRRADLTPEVTALADLATGERITYRAFRLRARALAALLAGECGVQPGDRVAVLAANAPEYLDAFFAVVLLGATLAPLNWRLTPAELGPILTDCAPRLILHDAAYADLAATAARSAALVSPPRLLAFAEFPGARADLAETVRPFASADGEEPALILSTSGTTGVPKGALLSHRMITWNAINTQISWGLRETDSTLTFAPFFHAGGLNVLTTPLLHCGGTVALVRGNDPGAILRAVAAERLSILFAVPTVFQALLEHPEFATTDLSSLRFLVTGGASCPLPVIAGYAARGLVFRQGYGLTEVGVNCFSLAPEDALRKAGSVGKPVFHSRARIVDADDRDVPAGAVGELILAGPHVCSGYLHRPAETAAAWRGGWWHTGDLARRDLEGYYTIVGRQKELYISGGENVSPAEIEAVLATHPRIAEAAVISQPDPKWGEVGVAVVVARDAALTAADVLAFCADRLARFKLPKRVVFVPALPRNAMGKVIKTELQAQFVEGNQV